MSGFRHFLGRIKLQLQRRKSVVGWNMTPDEAVSFIRQRGKTVLTFFGYSGMGYEDEHAMLQIARQVLKQYRPEKTLVLIGATEIGVGAVYRVAKAMDFETAGIVTSLALEQGGVSSSVDHICFIEDTQWGGKLPNSDELSPTSQAMVRCSDILVGIGGNEISRDEMMAGKQQGKPIQFFPAEVSHERSIRRAKYLKLPVPETFHGAAHEVFGK